MQVENQFQLGPLILRVGHDQSAIHNCTIMLGELGHPYDGPVSPLSKRIATQLQAYFHYRRATFDLPLTAAGTSFQTRVWQQLQQIPAGAPLTYGQLARQLNTAAQPIGGACKANPIGFFIPCHRIVAAQAIGGYAGAWGQGPQLDIKRWLLDHEQGFSHDVS
ncbi:MAG: methylated-DNA--[protein]-cysteine S-methyltransferase [Idiomarina sp.]|nr:methylated-DNA--[protein]-cysteine S-methyltransferase [Idiomarina sp.]